MRIAVLGATGATGREIVKQALFQGHEVTALVRRPEALDVTHERLSVVVGDATEEKVIANLVPGHDAVIASLGRPESGHSKAEIDDSVEVNVCYESTKHLYKHLPQHGIKRLVLMSTHGSGTSNDGSPYVVQLRDWVGKRVKDKDDMEAFIDANRDAPIDFTVIRNPLIYPGQGGRPFGVFEQVEFDDTSKIPVSDLARFAIAEAVDGIFVNKFVSISEPLTGPSAAKWHLAK
ncbi:NAD(P)-dependent oxidoreductase [Leucobacter denitrificans]|uniref:NAD(P)H-binding protein n=1 Tax=Leucobacter denitrificans TaxID=683042 RepID=A0A7G9S499_9MICO|nr:NAD(P)H-binding protein [Leucobacter denitrificans]QNN62674.1 NAD(P)H-binding protein [Leucobacter denitrificans]